MKYNFKDLLSPPEFELLCRDLLQRKLGITLESFKEGKDGGIDFKFSTPSNTNSIIVQCKNSNSHYKDFFKLLQKELLKIKKLKPDKYILMTSVNLSNINKEKIKECFQPYILETSDIYGNDDLNNLLSQDENKDIERKHSKLWISTTNILKRIFHSEIYCQSDILFEEIKLKVPYFVQTKSFDESLRILQQEHCCIISGNPGVGKTMLAHMLLLEFIKNDEKFEIIEINSMKEVNKVWNKDKKQVFYFDDFLGKNFRTLKMDRNEDKNIVRLMQRVSKDTNKYIIFTTREYILSQAKYEYEEFTSDSFELSKMIIDINNYSNKIKAEILYNHIKFSSLSDEYIYALLNEYTFVDIISHNNYNPRIVEHLTDMKLLGRFGITVSEYGGYFLDNLDNPVKIWSDIFENNKISFEAKIFLYTLFIENINEDRLVSHIDTEFFSKSFLKLHNFYLGKGAIKYQESIFEKVMKELDNSIIRINKAGADSDIIDFYDPSINDYLLQYLSQHEHIVVEIIKGLELFILDDHKTRNILLNLFDFNGDKYTKKLIFTNDLKQLFISEIKKIKNYDIDNIYFINKIMSINNIQDKTLNDVIFRSLSKFYLYENDENITVTLLNKESKNLFFLHDIECLCKFYFLSKQYGVFKYTNQELYDLSLCRLSILPTQYNELESLIYITKLDNIVRNIRKEKKEVENFLRLSVDCAFELEELEDMLAWEEKLKNVFNVKVRSTYFGEKWDELLNELESVENIEENDIPPYSDEDMNITQIISLFDSLRLDLKCDFKNKSLSESNMMRSIVKVWDNF